MKTTEILQGGVYHDNKFGLREVVSIGGCPARVTYRILAAKVEQEYSYADEKMVSLIGATSACELVSFAQWAKAAISPEDYDRLLSTLAAKRLRLAPGERAFMGSLCRDFTGQDAIPVAAGTTVSYNFNETRTVRGLEKKVVLSVHSGPPGAGGEITLTELGAAWIRLALKEAETA